MGRIKIEDLPAFKDLPPEQMKAIAGGGWPWSSWNWNNFWNPFRLTQVTPITTSNPLIGNTGAALRPWR